MKLSQLFQMLDNIEIPDEGLDYAPIILFNSVVGSPWSESNKTGFRYQTSSDNKQYVTGKIEQFRRKLNGNFQDNWIFSCWNPELFEKLEKMSKSDHTYVLIGRTSTTKKEVNGKTNYYKNVIIEMIPDQDNL